MVAGRRMATWSRAGSRLLGVGAHEVAEQWRIPQLALGETPSWVRPARSGTRNTCSILALSMAGDEPPCLRLAGVGDTGDGAACAGELGLQVEDSGVIEGTPLDGPARGDLLQPSHGESAAHVRSAERGGRLLGRGGTEIDTLCRQNPHDVSFPMLGGLDRVPQREVPAPFS